MSVKIALQTIPLILLALLVIAILIPACAPNPNTVKRVDDYKSALSKANADALPAGSPKVEGSLQSFTAFLQNVGNKEYVSANTAKVYAGDAYLNDTLVTHHGPEEIKAYFLKTADNMKSYKVDIDDTASSGSDHYVRWTMVFTSSSLNGGKPVHSVGMSHVRFNTSGQVVIHQDYWDSGTTIYGQIPVVGGLIETIRRRFEK